MSAAEPMPVEWDWRELAACVGTPIDWWFPTAAKNDEGGDGCAPPEAVALCAQCPVRGDCLDHAIRHEQFGVWAGMSAKQITRLRRAAGVRLSDIDPVAAERERAARLLYEGGTPPPDDR